MADPVRGGRVLPLTIGLVEAPLPVRRRKPSVHSEKLETSLKKSDAVRKQVGLVQDQDSAHTKVFKVLI